MPCLLAASSNAWQALINVTGPYGNFTLSSSDNVPLLANECLTSRNGNFSLCLWPSAFLRRSDQDGNELWVSGLPVDNGVALQSPRLMMQVRHIGDEHLPITMTRKAVHSCD